MLVKVMLLLMIAYITYLTELLPGNKRFFLYHTGNLSLTPK